jgi:Uma2 family endonuclease
MTFTKLHLWTVDEYHRMIESGILSADQHVELLDGLIVEMTPQLPPHASTTSWASDNLRTMVQGRAAVRVQMPITLSPKSEPEPDIAIVQLTPDLYVNHHPTPREILLLVEVADRTLASDRTQKALTYAKAGISDYWILDVNTRQVYVLRQPTLTGYQQETILPANTILAPVAFPDLNVPLNQLFPG